MFNFDMHLELKNQPWLQKPPNPLPLCFSCLSPFFTSTSLQL
uniref:Uncharacterized protein n=1 Tax=Anguilla anguilla TaxID=7936 RepID=A0A0E9RFK1_ANGAN